MKIVLIIDKDLPRGLAANTAAVLGISLGKMFPEIVREPACDAEGNEYSGITSLAIPVLSAEGQRIKDIAGRARHKEAVTLIPFTKIAQLSKDYDAYKAELLHADSVQYSGIALVGDEREVSAFTGSLPLFR